MESSLQSSNRDFYREKWQKISDQLPSQHLKEKDLHWIKDQFIEQGLSFSQAKQLCEMAQRLYSWPEKPLHQWEFSADESNFWQACQDKWQKIIKKLPDYNEQKSIAAYEPKVDQLKFTSAERQGKFLKICPAYSEEYSCCGLEVINVVENCAYACSYCVLHNFYGDREIRITSNLKEKLETLEIDPKRQYRIGTGEYSDSLLWGNRENILGLLMEFARKHDNVCLELKTKSVNIDWLLKNHQSIPPNLMVSWSVNPQTIIQYEEHGTPSLKARLDAARKCADAGIFVGFNFHPMVRYKGYQKDYQELAQTIMNSFQPEEVLLISIGSLSFLKQHQDKLGLQFPSSLLLKSPLENKGDNKVGYPREERIELYRSVCDPLKAWQGKAFQYLCMEKQEVFEEVLGFSYPSSTIFHESMNEDLFAKIAKKRQK